MARSPPIPRSCASARCGWSQRSVRSMRPSGPRSARSRRSSGSARRRRCASGSARPRSTPGTGRARPARSRRRSGGCGGGERRAAPGQRDPEGGVGFLRGRARPATAALVRFIDEHQGRVRGRADLPRADRARLQDRTQHLLRRQGPARLRPRAVRDEQLKAEISRVHATTTTSTARGRCGGS